MRKVQTILGIFDENKYLQFKTAYNQAVETNKKDFVFANQIILVNFAKYMLEYLELQFKDK